MPYFIIIPLYLALLMGLAVAAVTTRLMSRLRPASGYIVGGMVGTLPGVLIANAAAIVIGMIPVWLARDAAMPERLHGVMGIVFAAILLIGPFAASVMGVCSGFVIGAYIVFRRRRRHAAEQPAPANVV